MQLDPMASASFVIGCDAAAGSKYLNINAPSGIVGLHDSLPIFIF
jgi:hypothetical protein